MTMKTEPIETNPVSQGQQLRDQSSSVANEQWLRELTKNGMEAIDEYIKKYPEDKNYKPEIQIRDHELLTPSHKKISIIDNGIGMNPDDMVEYIRLMGKSSELKEEGGKNFGVGAKVSSVTRNPLGVIYDSWQKGGKGFSITLWHDVDNDIYGVKPIDDNGERMLYQAVEDESMPELIRKTGHGTRVTLFGKNDPQDTTAMEAHDIKEGTNDGRWRARVINKRFYDFPEGITIKNQRNRLEPKERISLSSVKPLKETLENSYIKKGTVRLSDADIDWWILEKNRKKSSKTNVDSHEEFISGHTAVIYENEVFGITLGRGNIARDFGVAVAPQNVVIHIRPHEGKGFHQDYTRREILKNSNKLEYTIWQDEFLKNFPKELDDYIKSLVDQPTQSDRVDKLLNKYKKYFNLPKLKINENGEIGIDESQLFEGQAGIFLDGEGCRLPSIDPKPREGIIDSYNGAVRKENGKNATKVNDPFPKVEWINDDGGVISDRAAMYDEKKSNKERTIYANKDFVGFLDMCQIYFKKYKNIQINPSKITEIIKSSYEMRLKESVAGALLFKTRSDWSKGDFLSAVSPESLTVAVSSKVHMMQEIEKNIIDYIKESKLVQPVSEE